MSNTPNAETDSTVQVVVTTVQAHEGVFPQDETGFCGFVHDQTNTKILPVTEKMDDLIIIFYFGFIGCLIALCCSLGVGSLLEAPQTHQCPAQLPRLATSLLCSFVKQTASSR